MQDLLVEMIADMSEGNPGAINAIMICTKERPEAPAIIWTSGLRGPQIWLAYKDYAEYDPIKTIEAIDNKDPELAKLLKKRGHPAGW
jgi:hypothetical protein